MYGAAVGAQRAAQRELVPRRVAAHVARERGARGLALVARARDVERSAELDVRFTRAQPDVVAEAHRHAVELEVLDERARRLRHDRAVAHVGRVEELREVVGREIDDLLANELGNEDRAAIDDHRAGQRRFVGRAGERQSGGSGRDVEPREPALVHRAQLACVEPDIESRLREIAEDNRSLQRRAAAARGARPVQLIHGEGIVYGVNRDLARRSR